MYGHVVETPHGTWLQYWFYFSYNSQDRGLVKTGRHEGDWELFQIRLDRTGTPRLTTLAQHTWAEGCDWAELQRDGSAPVLSVANGSHALYSSAATWDRPFPDPNDEADGLGRRVRPAVHEIRDGSPRWVERRQLWGDSRASWIPGEQSSPPGPKFQAGGAWTNPAGFHAERARECGSGPPGRWWATWLVAGVAGGLVLALMARRRLDARRAATIAGDDRP